MGSRSPALLVLVLPAGAAAQPASNSESTWAYESPTCDLAIDGGIAVGFPSALPTGLARGIGGGFSRGWKWIAVGARASWTSATEDSDVWAVSHDEFEARATAAVQHAAGRGRFALRLGLGGTLVREHRIRHQGMRAGLMGDDLENTAIALLPMGSLEGVITLHVRGPWSIVLAGGPTLTIVDDAATWGWTAEAGVAWQR